MKTLLKFKEAIIDYDDQILCTLEDGRCALVDLKNETVVIEILLDSFMKWFPYGGNTNISKEKVELSKKIIETTDKIGCNYYAEKYLEDEQIKKQYDKLKQEAGYNY